MPPIILVLLQALFLILLYVFVARAVRAVVRDVNRAAASSRLPAAATGARPRPQPPARPVAPTSRRTRGRATQLVVHQPGERPRIVALDGSEISFGRGDDCTISLHDSYASERHARIYPSGDDWLVADMGSTNGTFLNRAKVAGPTPIQPGDQLGIGKTVVEVRK